MWWNLDIFGKFAFEIRMDYWYLWKTHFLNFRDFQESPSPLEIMKAMSFEDMKWNLQKNIQSKELQQLEIIYYVQLKESLPPQNIPIPATAPARYHTMFV